MVRARPVLPAGHGEVLTTPPSAEWADVMQSNIALAREWSFDVAGRQVCELRAMARQEALGRAAAFSARLGVTVAPPGDPGGPIVMTGHQPVLYHPGVWVKDFLLDEIARATRATPVDLIVDSDGFEAVSMTAPCMRPRVERCEVKLATGAADTCYACAPVPSPDAIQEFCDAGTCALDTLPTPAIRKHFRAFCDLLPQAAADAGNLAEFVTFARRRYEACAGTAYLELPVTSLAASEAFCAFVADIALHADRFVSAYNGELDEYRAVTKTRSSAQPFPDLERRGARVELPLWLLGAKRREAVWAESDADGVRVLSADGSTILRLPADPLEATRALVEARVALAPKALALTLFARVFVADLFIHGIGGARYDSVTDAVIRRYYRIEPPRFVVASMTMYLPLGAHVVSEEELAVAIERANRFEHNPDTLLEEVDFETPTERSVAVGLAAEKGALVEAIARPDADRRVLGSRIREINAELRELLEPFGSELKERLEGLRSERAVGDVLTDRTYPFCFWSPAEVADKVR